MKKNRLMYFITLAIIMVLCYYEQKYWISLIGYVWIVLPIVSLLYTIVIYRSFAYTQEVDRKFITKGETVYFHFSIYNEHYLFYPDIEILFYGVDSILGKYFESRRVTVAGGSNKNYSYPLKCNYRGYYEVGIEKVYIYDFLRIFRIPYKVFEPKYITVYPRIVLLETFPLHQHTLEESEMLINQYKADSTVLSDIRAYSYGDSMRKIHWKLTAKKQMLMVKNSNATVDGQVYILLDLRRHEGEVDEKALVEDRMVECSLAVVHYCREHGLGVTLHAQEKQLGEYPVITTADFESMYQFLFKVKFCEEMPLEEVIRHSAELNDREKSMVIITSHITRALYEPLYKWAVDGKEVIVIYVPMPENKEETKNIFYALKEVGVKVFVIELLTDLKIQLENERGSNG